MDKNTRGASILRAKPRRTCKPTLHFLLTGARPSPQRTLWTAHDVREVKARKMNAAQKKRAVLRGELEPDEEPIVLDKLDDEGLRPEHQVMAKDLHDRRKDLLTEFDGRAVKSIMVDLNNVAVSIPKKDDPEKILAQGAVAKLRSLIAGQSR